MNLYNILIHTHSGFRWVALILMIIAITEAIRKNRSNWSTGTPGLFFHLPAMIIIHLQLVIGLVLYFISPKVIFAASAMKDSVLRFYLVEHIALMLIAIVLITVGYVKSKKVAGTIRMFKPVIVYYLIGLALILVSIPWPFRGLGAGWF